MSPTRSPLGAQRYTASPSAERMGKTQESRPEQRQFAEGGRVCLPETRLLTDPLQPWFTKSPEDRDRL